MPVPSISRTPFAGRPRSLIGTCGAPTETTSVIRFPSTTTSIGPCGAAPVPSITVIPRITSRVYGPPPSAGSRSGAAISFPAPAATRSSPGTSPCPPAFTAHSTPTQTLKRNPALMLKPRSGTSIRMNLSIAAPFPILPLAAIDPDEDVPGGKFTRPTRPRNPPAPLPIIDIYECSAERIAETEGQAGDAKEI